MIILQKLWNDISETMIKDCFNNAGFLPNSDIDNDETAPSKWI